MLDSPDLNFKLKNYQRSAEILCELLAKVEDGCMERSLKNGKMLMLCLKASLLLSKVQNIQGQQNSSQVPNIIIGEISLIPDAHLVNLII